MRLRRLTKTGEIETFTIRPEKYGLSGGDPDDLSPAGDIKTETRRFTGLIGNRENSFRKEAVLLNAALIFYVAGTVPDVETGGWQSWTKAVASFFSAA